MAKIQDCLQQIWDKQEQLELQLEAVQLLESVWQELGPYSGAISYVLMNKLHKFFDFDDSE